MHFKMLSAICFNLDQSKILLSVNGLRCAILNMNPASVPFLKEQTRSKFINVHQSQGLEGC